MEVRIVWKYPPEQFVYLRETTYWTMRFKGPIYGWSGRNGWVKTLEELKKVADVRREMRDKGENMKCAPDAHLLIGYAEVVKTHSRVGYQRRYWWLRSYDRDVRPDGVYAKGHPCEAVDPLSIAINHRSERGTSESESHRRVRRMKASEKIVT